ncbi:MAG: hypothetical protein QXN37_00250 [Candidatus Anstonellaceae archaeon]
MALREICKLDSKGRVLIPQHLREAAGIMADDRLIVGLDEKTWKITIEPAREKKILRLTIALSDKPGALASAALTLANLGVDLVSSHSHSTRRGEAALWIVECNPSANSVKMIKSELEKCNAKLISAKLI